MSTKAAIEARADRTPAPKGNGPGRAVRTFRRFEGLLISLSGFVGIGLLWEWAVRTEKLKEIFISSPSNILAAFVHEFEQGVIWGHLRVSAIEFFVGFIAGIVVGALIGLAAGWSQRAHDYIYPWMITGYVTPTIVFIPIFILWIGIGIGLKIVFVFLGTVFVMALNALAGVHSVDHAFHNVARAFGADRWMVLKSIVIPGMLPFVLTGIRQASGRALIMVVVAELIASNQGIGFVLAVSATLINTRRVMMVVVFLALLGIVINWATGILERKVEKWRPAGLGS